jgi:sugar phosphate isomerase/epimerase
MNLDHFGPDTITFAGSLEAKLKAARAAGFTQIMLSAADIAGHPDGEEAAIDAVRESGLRVTGLQVLRDFEGLSGHLHAYKVDIAKAMLEMCHALGSRVLLACSSTSRHAAGDPALLARDLAKLAMLAVPLQIRIAYEALSWGRHVNEFPRAWDIVQAADRANLGVAVDSYHLLASGTDPGALREIDVSKVYLVQLSDFLWRRRARPRIASRPRGTSASSPVKACTASRWRRSCATSTRWATGATTASKSSTTTTSSCRWPSSPGAHAARSSG